MFLFKVDGDLHAARPTSRPWHAALFDLRVPSHTCQLIAAPRSMLSNPSISVESLVVDQILALALVENHEGARIARRGMKVDSLVAPVTLVCGKVEQRRAN